MAGLAVWRVVEKERRQRREGYLGTAICGEGGWFVGLWLRGKARFCIIFGKPATGADHW